MRASRSIQRTTVSVGTGNTCTWLAIISPIIQTLDRKRIPEDRLRQLEAHTMGSQVGPGFGLVPLEFH